MKTSGTLMHAARNLNSFWHRLSVPFLASNESLESLEGKLKRPIHIGCSTSVLVFGSWLAHKLRDLSQAETKIIVGTS